MSRRSSAVLLLLGVHGAAGFAYPDARARWTLPYDSLSQEGLSRKIRFALHPDFCEELRGKFFETKLARSFGAVGLVRCEEIEETMNRAFNAWAFNNKRLDFYNVTSYCTEEELAASQCEAVEMMIVASATGSRIPGNVTLTTSSSLPIDTSGVDTRMSWYPDPEDAGYIEALGGYVAGNIPAEPTRVISPGNVVTGDQTITHAHIRFTADDDVCWYLDDSICTSFWKNDIDKEKLLDGMYGVCVLTGTLILMYRGVRLWGGLILKGKEFAHKILMIHLSNFAVTWLIGALIIIPNAVYFGMLKSCIDCYSFEATAVHLIGQSLGIGVLEDGAATMSVLQRQDTSPPSPVTMGMDDLGYGRVCQNAYRTPAMGNSYLEETDWTEECDSDDEPWTCKNRDFSVMLPLDYHHNRPCLSDDDLEALNWLYPSCYGANKEPICVRADRNHTIIKVLALIGMPLFVMMLGTFLALLYSRRRQRKRLAKQKLMHHCLDLFGDKAKVIFDRTDALKKEKKAARQKQILAEMKAQSDKVQTELDTLRTVSIKKTSLSLGKKAKGAAKGAVHALHLRKTHSTDGVETHFIPVDTRVQHPTHGVGIVVEIMHNGRTRVMFDSGDEHRYKPDSLHKLSAPGAPGLSYDTSSLTSVNDGTKMARRNKLRGPRRGSFMPAMPTVGILNKKRSSCAAPMESPREADEQGATSEAQV